MIMRIIFLAFLTACTGNKDCGKHQSYSLKNLTITKVAVRVAKGGQNSAVYFTISNQGQNSDQLISANSQVCKKVEIHDHISETNEDGIEIKKMRPVKNITINGGEKVALAPGGLHVMLLVLNRNIDENDGIPVTLTFAKSGSVRVMAVAAKNIKCGCKKSINAAPIT